ncbi:ABC transporter ATP-binding protein [Agrobacterium tumefaciens]|jgi:peptide/nickel transport system ATP-binding protein|uniref:dipeptide ABC transporter ATP-binding protein n=1 Tax=Agrobacterium tumefaciens TaxID=358 RepID=UPI00023A3136|nr:ABC transporter ATP-binding protein [Agrobacterium tumefaciens]EHJ96386.1 ABC transporter ATPase/substrate-binding protein [Agrobacterium tumefaciens 5A]UXU08740.1 ABC transporter ATP-binding protein [Agrobacterium tumefaciens]WCK68867.1 ABC transporter ATP-binding protein [Agrobacterium tumefaciens]
MIKPLLELQNLTVNAGRSDKAKIILDNISFSLAPREIVGVVGASGAGKTVLSKAVVNWLEPPLSVRSGSVLFEGKDIYGISENEMRTLRRRVAYVGANPMGALDPTLPVGVQIVEKLRAVVPGTSRKEAEKRTIELLEAVRIPSARSRFSDYPSQFSGGMMQRALIVDALVTNPALLIADNVTQPLDVTVAAQVIRLLKELTDGFNTAVLFVSSSLPVAREACNRILVMEKGRIVEEQETERLIAAPAYAYTKELVEQTPKIWIEKTEMPRLNDKRDVVLSLRDASQVYRVKKKTGFGGFNHVRAVRNVTFDVRRGDSFAIVGESGCGKSTLMRLLSRLELPSSGQVLCGADDIAMLGGKDLLTFRKKLQMVLQDPFGSLPPRTSVGKMLEGPLRTHGWKDSAKIRERVLKVMGEVGLSADLYEELPIGLSAGQRQRINVARALVLEPEILIMDETLSALDQTEQFKLLDLFQKLQKEYDLTYIFISHDLAMVRKVCNRVAVMYLGEVFELADNERLFFDPGHPYTMALLSAMPTLEERRYKAEDCLLEGEPPSPIDIPPGCSFKSRCPRAMERCGSLQPALTARGSQDFAACHLIQPLALDDATRQMALA